MSEWINEAWGDFKEKMACTSEQPQHAGTWGDTQLQAGHTQQRDGQSGGAAIPRGPSSTLEVNSEPLKILHQVFCTANFQTNFSRGIMRDVKILKG